MINPLPFISSLKTCELVTDLDGDGQVSPGDTLKCTIRITNTGQQSISSLLITDADSPYTTYVCGSTTHGSDPGVAITDGTGCQSSLSSGLVLDTNLPPGGADEISYEVTINSLAEMTAYGYVDTIETAGTVKDASGSTTLSTFDTRTTIAVTANVELTKTASDDGSCPGQTSLSAVTQGSVVTFCFLVHNTGSSPLSSVVIIDPYINPSTLTYTDNGGILDINATWSTSATVTATNGMTNTATEVVIPPILMVLTSII